MKVTHRRVSFSQVLGVIAAQLVAVWLGGCAASPAPVQIQDRIRMGETGLQDARGQSFVPLGVTYFRPGTGWAPQVWKEWDSVKTRRDLERLKALGANTVRVFITYGSFQMEEDRLDEVGLAKFAEFLSMAGEIGLYVQPTGLEGWEGVPDWMNREGGRGDEADRYADEANLAMQEGFWIKFVERFKGHSGILAYELANEPSIRWTSPAMAAKWRLWCQRRYATIAELQAAWGANAASSYAAIEIPAPEAKRLDQRLLDYQSFREDIAAEWTRRQANAIRSVDPSALVTIGLVQWSVPVKLFTVQQYAAFRPHKLAPWLDFLELHFYPWDSGFYQYESPAVERANLAYLDATLQATREAGLPVVLGEFGWYGGGKPTFEGGRYAYASEAQQARWNRAVIEQTRGKAVGWLAWTLYDYPDSQDPTELSGMLKPDGALKAWGRYFREVAPDLARLSKSKKPEVRRLKLDWAQAVTDPAAGDEFRAAFGQTYRQSSEK